MHEKNQGTQDKSESLLRRVVQGAFGEVVLFFHGKIISGEGAREVPTSRQILDRLKRRQ